MIHVSKPETEPMMHQDLKFYFGKHDPLWNQNQNQTRFRVNRNQSDPGDAKLTVFSSPLALSD